MARWEEIKQLALDELHKRGLDGPGSEYIRRLKLEFKEVDKQGANQQLTAKFNDGFKYETNKSGLVFPWLLGMTPVDPLTSQHRMDLQTDMPDVDLDCLPDARDKIKEYASNKYGKEKVCSVGTWMTYKFRSALQDVVRAYGYDLKEVTILTTSLPDDVDELKDGGMAPCVGCKTKHRDTKCPKCGSEEVDGTTIGKLIEDHDNLAVYNKAHPDVVDMAVRLVGKIKAMGTHAGGLIISDIELLGNIPMALSNGKWTSMWTEGRSPQLSKFGFVKWDVLGLKTLQYIHECCHIILKTRGIKFDVLPWSRQDRFKNILGTYADKDGNTHHIRMDDPEVFEMMNELRTETVFQFETDVQRGILSNGVRDYYDLQVFNAMGHPGPMDMIPDYAKRRDDSSKKWLKDEQPDIAQALIETHGIIVYQEDLQRIWQKFAAFTAPEAEAARKAVAKKWRDKLKPVKEKWLTEAAKIIGKEWAEKWWDRMESFGRYAFNKSHSCAYIMVAYLTAWLKVHFAPEWWAAVMSTCHHEKLTKYMNIARSEGVKFGDINVENLSFNFTVQPGTLTVTPGLTTIKGVGISMYDKLQKVGTYKTIDDFIEANGKNKTLMERLIKLGSFQRYHPNIKATWMWYQYKYCSDVKELKKEIHDKLLVDWPQERIEQERQRQIGEFRLLHPKRNKIPNKILNWTKKPDDTREAVMALFPEDFTLRERLSFEKQYLGFYWHSPMDLYHVTEGRTIKDAKEDNTETIECVIEKVAKAKTKRNSDFLKLSVSDGLHQSTIIVWEDDIHGFRRFLEKDLPGIRLDVVYDSDRDSFTVQRGASPRRLETITEYEQRMRMQECETSPAMV